MKSFFSPSYRNRGQGLVEYAVIIALVAIVVIVGISALGPRIGNTFSSINNSLGDGGILSGGGNDNDGGGDPPQTCAAASAAHGQWHADWNGNPNADQAQHDALEVAMNAACG
jgi:pilus assembly protein Flp/PilA